MFKMQCGNHAGTCRSDTHSVEKVSSNFSVSIPNGERIYVYEVSEKKIGYYQQVTTEVKEQVEVGKTYKTVGGREFTVVKIDPDKPYPVLGYCITEDDVLGRTYTLSGVFNRHTSGPDFPYNLILETKKVTSVKFFPEE